MNKLEKLNKLFINGVWRDGKSDFVLDVINPFNNEVIYKFKGANQADLDEAYESAKKAQKAWAARLPNERSAIVNKVADLIELQKDEISDIMARECGSTFIKQQVEMAITANICREAATFPTRLHGYIYDSFTPSKESRAYRKPLGVIGVISPFNFPFNLSMRSVATAIAIGNAVVLKPAEDTPIIGGMLIAKLFEEAGLPAGVLNVVTGNIAEIGDAFTSHPIPNMISFTGSTPVGIRIGKIAAEGLKKTALELGGNNVFVVLKDADIDQAVSAAIFGKFMHQGQICMSVNRFLIQKEVAEEFTTKFVKKVSELKYGNPTDKEVLVGPVIHDRAADRIMKLVDDAVKEGAKIAVGGTREGRLIAPTVLVDVSANSIFNHTEIFGPVAPIIVFDTEEQMLEIANGTDFGLSGAIHTRDLNKGVQLARKIETGMIHVNDQTVNDEPNAPFGGVKHSGLGTFNGNFILEDFSTVQWVTVQQEPRDYTPFN